VDYSKGFSHGDPNVLGLSSLSKKGEKTEKVIFFQK
jgi:hypothetical protein